MGRGEGGGKKSGTGSIWLGNSDEEEEEGEEEVWRLNIKQKKLHSL